MLASTSMVTTQGSNPFLFKKPNMSEIPSASKCTVHGDSQGPCLPCCLLLEENFHLRVQALFIVYVQHVLAIRPGFSHALSQMSADNMCITPLEGNLHSLAKWNTSVSTTTGLLACIARVNKQRGRVLFQSLGRCRRVRPACVAYAFPA